MRVILIGAGKWGQNHQRILIEMGVLEGVVDMDQDVLRASPLWVNRYSDVLNCPLEKYDAAVICTPADTHYLIAKVCIEAGLHVFVEKPMCMKSEQVKELMLLTKKVLTCGFIERFNPAIKMIPRAVGKSHDIKDLTMYRGGNIPEQSKDTGIIYDTTIHDIDLANYLFNSTPTSLSCRIYKKSARLQLNYDGGRQANIKSKWGLRRERYIIVDGVKIDMINEVDKLKAELWNFVLASQGKEFLVVTAQETYNAIKIAESCYLYEKIRNRRYQRILYKKNPEPQKKASTKWNKANKPKRNEARRIHYEISNSKRGLLN